MTGSVVVDANLLLLLVVGATDRGYIGVHKRLRDDYSDIHFELLQLLISQFSEMILVPNVLTEVSNFARQIKNPARSRIMATFKTLAETGLELPVASRVAVQSEGFAELGLTDAVLLQICALELPGASPTLLTADGRLAAYAGQLGLGAINFREFLEA